MCTPHVCTVSSIYAYMIHLYLIIYFLFSLNSELFLKRGDRKYTCGTCTHFLNMYNTPEGTCTTHIIHYIYNLLV